MGILRWHSLALAMGILRRHRLALAMGILRRHRLALAMGNHFLRLAPNSRAVLQQEKLAQQFTLLIKELLK
jgi:hypothetical protein